MDKLYLGHDVHQDPLLQRLQQLRGRPITPMDEEQLASYRQQAHRREFYRIQREATQARLDHIMDSGELTDLSHLTFDNWDPAYINHGAWLLVQAKDYAEQQCAIHSGQNLLVLGPQTSEKTHLTSAVIHKVVQHRQATWLARLALPLAQELVKPAVQPKSRARRKQAYNHARLAREAGLLMLVDLDNISGHLDQALQQALGKLIRQRSRRALPTLITSRWETLGQLHDEADPQLIDAIESTSPLVLQLKCEQEQVQCLIQ